MKEVAYVISTKPSIDRRDKLTKHMENRSSILIPKYFPALEGTPGWIHCALSHLKLVEYAKSLDMPYIVVLEDDTELCEDFDTYFRPVLKFLRSRTDWDVFNGNPTNIEEYQNFQILSKNPNIVRFYRGFTTNFIIYSKRSYDKVLGLKHRYVNLLDIHSKGELVLGERINYHAYDLRLVELDLKFITNIPYISKQAEGYSIIEDKVLNYDTCIYEWGLDRIYKKLGEDLDKKLVLIRDYNFTHQKYSVQNQFSSNILWYRINLNDLKSVTDEIVFFTDVCLDEVVNVKNCVKVAWLLEPPSINPRIYDKVETLENHFDYILTFDRGLISKKDSSKYLYYPVGGCWIKKEEWSVYDKSKLISLVASTKMDTDGHKLRHTIADKIKGVDLYGKAYKEVENKLDAMKDYCFQIVVENSILDDYFTEKICDCFATGCVPVYWGTNCVNELFDKDGIICFRTLEELEKIIPTLTFKKYNSMLDSVKRNFEIVERYRVTENWLYINLPHLFSFKHNKNKATIDKVYKQIWEAYGMNNFSKVVFLSDTYLSLTDVNNKETQHVKFLRAYSLHSMLWLNEAKHSYKDTLKDENLNNNVEAWSKGNLNLIKD